MKKFLSTAIFCLFILISKPAFAADIPVYIDSVKVEFTDAAPQTVNDRIMVPMRAIFEKLGADVQWDSDTLTATAKKGDSIVSLSINNDTAKLNGKDKKLDTPPTTISDRTYVPIRFVSEALGAKVYWNDTTSTVYIYGKDYLSTLNDVKLKAILSPKFGKTIKTSLGEIEVEYFITTPKDAKTSVYDYNVMSALNQFKVNKIINSTAYTDEQKTLFKRELKQHQSDVGNFMLDITSDSYRIVGSYIFIDGYKDTEKKVPIFQDYYNWATFDYKNKIIDHNGLRWAPEVDTFKF